MMRSYCNTECFERPWFPAICVLDHGVVARNVSLALCTDALTPTLKP